VFKYSNKGLILLKFCFSRRITLFKTRTKN
jgi:hypothetical protein